MADSSRQLTYAVALTPAELRDLMAYLATNVVANQFIGCDFTADSLTVSLTGEDVDALALNAVTYMREAHGAEPLTYKQINLVDSGVIAPYLEEKYENGELDKSAEAEKPAIDLPVPEKAGMLQSALDAIAAWLGF